MAIEVIAFAAGLLGLLLLVVVSWSGPRERPPPPDRGAFIPGLHHFDGDDDHS
jgi:hypothetical protein